MLEYKATVRTRAKGGARVALLLAGVALAASAQPVSAETAGAAAAQATAEPDIIVTGQALFRDIQPERDLNEESIYGYGESTVDGLLSELQQELGDGEQPLILVNGERINDLDEIGALPVEVLKNVRVLPRGSAVRIGGRSGQRVVSLTLNRISRTATVTAASKLATEGDWHAARGEAIGTYIHDSTRANLTLRARGESNMLESERGIVQPAPRLPYATSGNVIAYPDLLGEIDPFLSAAAGEIVTVAPVPLSANPTLEDFAANANEAATTDISDFRTLRPRVRNFDLNGTFATRLAPWLTSNTTLRLSRNTTRSKRGLPSALFVLSPDNPASPFSTDVGLTYYSQDPLSFRSQRDSGELNITLNAQFGKWIANFNARHSESKDVSHNERPNQVGAIFLDDAVNPFAIEPGDLILTRTDDVHSHATGNLAVLSATGPAAKLPAGDLQATIEGRLLWNRQHSESSFSSASSDRNYHRAEQSVRAAVDVPLTSVETGFLADIGNTNATAEYSRVHFSDAGTLDYHSLGLTWEPRPTLRLRAEIEKSERAASVQLLANPTVITPEVRVFDPLTGETVDVVQITGGIRTLEPETTKIRRVSGQWTLVPRLNLQLNAEYTDTDVRDFLSSLPEASAAVMLAFPDRYVRDANGVLVTTDLRPVNFDSHREKRLRYGLSLNAGLGGGGANVVRSSASTNSDTAEEPDREREPASRPTSVRRPPTRLQLTANHSIVFSDEISIRPGLGSIDLLEGGAIGIAGGRLRHQFDGTASITSGGLGARLGISWRGRSTLDSRINGVVQELEFSPVFLVNLRAFTDAARIFGHNDWTSRTRILLNVTNLINDRQEVRDSGGDTPLQYQPAYRDALGRTVELEIRKVF